MMGSKKVKTTQTNKPIYSAEIGGAANNITNAYNASQPAVANLTSNLGQASQSLFDRYKSGGDPATSAASDYIVRTLGQDPQSNPFLEQQIALTNDNTRRAIQTQLGTRGGIGGSAERQIVSRELGNNELAARYADFDRTRQLQAQAAGMAPSIAAAGYLPLEQAAQYGTQGALLPSQLAAIQGAGIGGLLGQYQDIRGTQKQSGGLLGQILGSAAQLGSSAIMACDIRLKENIARIGKTPGGVPLYRFDYIGGDKGVIGPMAHEVAILQPDALGPEIDGYMTVNVGALQ